MNVYLLPMASSSFPLSKGYRIRVNGDPFAVNEPMPTGRAILTLAGLLPAVEADVPHGSVVMLPDGQMFGRVWSSSGKFEPIDCISVAGDDLHFWYADAGSVELPHFVASHAQAFDDGTIEQLRRLTVAVVGVSGTGSPTVEQLMRLGAAVIVNVDDDCMEERNVGDKLATYRSL